MPISVTPCAAGKGHAEGSVPRQGLDWIGLDPLQGRDFFWGQEKTLEPAKVSPPQFPKRKRGQGWQKGALRAVNTAAAEMLPLFPVSPAPGRGRCHPQSPPCVSSTLGRPCCTIPARALLALITNTGLGRKCAGFSS